MSRKRRRDRRIDDLRRLVYEVRELYIIQDDYRVSRDRMGDDLARIYGVV